MEKTEDDLLVERACGYLFLSKFEFFDHALTWHRGKKNSSAAAIDYNVYEHNELHTYPAYVLGYASEVVRTHQADKKRAMIPFKNVRSIRAGGRERTTKDNVVDLNRVRRTKNRDDEE